MTNDDPYIQLNGCLKNKLGITDIDEFNKRESALVDNRSSTPLPKGQFDYKHLKAIHHHLFQDVYDWAGQERSVNISKGDTQFCLRVFITPIVNKTLSGLEKQHYLKNLNKADFIPKIAHYFSEINAIHPFREGNGRSTRAFFSYLAHEAGYKLDFSQTNQKEWLAACIESMNTDNKKLAAIFDKITSPIGKKH